MTHNYCGDQGNQKRTSPEAYKGYTLAEAFDHFSLHIRDDDTENNVAPPTCTIPTGDKAPHFTAFLTTYLFYEVAHNSDITTLVLRFSKTRGRDD
jgi:hypothetical protein